MVMNMMKADGDDAINVRRRKRRRGGDNLEFEGTAYSSMHAGIISVRWRKKNQVNPSNFPQIRK